jgi:hypothetical protein
VTYEQVVALTREWYGTEETMAEMVERAILDRGGHCLKCSYQSELVAIKPPSFSGPLRSQNLLVQVRCSLNKFQRYPFRSEESLPNECPAYKRHMRQQQKLEMPIR